MQVIQSIEYSSSHSSNSSSSAFNRVQNAQSYANKRISSITSTSAPKSRRELSKSSRSTSETCEYVVNERHESMRNKSFTKENVCCEGIGRKRGYLQRTRASNIPDSFDPSKYGTGISEFPEEDGGRDWTLKDAIFGTEGWNRNKTRAPAKDRLLAILPYLIPMMGCIAFTNDGFEQFPLTHEFLDWFTRPMMIFYSNGFIPFLSFFGLFLAVVRNPKVPHFIRYNTMQAIMLDICIMLAGLIMQYIPMFLACGWVGGMVEVFAFMNGTYAIFYSVFNALQGKYAEIPIITEAVYAQVSESIANPDDEGVDD
jgi:uncharacterized membrane protein